MKRSKLRRLIVVLALAFCLPGVPARAQVGQMIDLGAPGGAQNFSYAYGINNSGQVVGYYYVIIDFNPGPERACLYNNGLWTDLGTLGGSISKAYAINNHGQVVGWSVTSDNQHHAFLYQGDAMTDLGTLAGNLGSSEAWDINDQGQIVGETTIDNGETHAFLINEGVMIDLGHLGGGMSYARGINNLGQVVGWSRIDEVGHEHAFLYTDGAMHDLGTLPGANFSWAYAINDYGQITGYSGNHAFLYTGVPGAGGVMTDLGPFPGYNYSWAYGINNRGCIVGFYDTFYRHRGFLYANGAFSDLGSLWPNFGATIEARGINDRGQIVGISSISASNAHAFLYNSRGGPEPGTMLMLAE